MQDLLLCAKHLFVAAKIVWPAWHSVGSRLSPSRGRQVDEAGQTTVGGTRDMSQRCRDRPGARTQAPNDRKRNDCGQRCDLGRAIVSAQLIRTIITLRYRTETTL